MNQPVLSQNRPDDFDPFWTSVRNRLSKMPAAPERDPNPMHSTDYADMFDIHLTSIGPYRIFAYLSIPHGIGPFPTRYYLPKYGSVVEPIPQGSANAQREQYVTFSLGVRGQRQADQPFSASFPGLLTAFIEDPHTYPFTGIVADCLRGLEYLVDCPEVDKTRIVAIGNDLALFTAALSSHITHLVCTPTLFFASGDVAPQTEEYPLEEFNDYYRINPTKIDNATRTLSYFDLRWFASSLQMPTLLMGAADGELLDRKTLNPLIQDSGTRTEFHAAEHSTYKDGLFVEEWITSKLGLGNPVLPEHWQQ